jgi:hypothetical protein
VTADNILSAVAAIYETTATRWDTFDINEGSASTSCHFNYNATNMRFTSVGSPLQSEPYKITIKHYI